MNSMDYTFWSTSVRLHPFEEHVRAAVAGGFNSLAIVPSLYFQSLARGLSAADMKAMAAEQGVPLTHLDTLTSWAPMQLADEFDAEMNERLGTSLEHGLEVCEELGLKSILACAAYRKGGVKPEQLIEGFANLCQQAAKLGVWVDLEPMPFFGCEDVAAAWAIVGQAGQDNSGILLDIWHFYKAGNQTLEVLDEIPGRYFRTMQINDAPAAQVCATLLEDTIKHRRFCGEGDLPVTDFIRAVYAKGHLRSVGPEVFNLAADLMTPEEAGRYAGKTSRMALERAGVLLPQFTRNSV